MSQRKFYAHDKVAVIDGWGGQISTAIATIIEVNEEEQYFWAILYGDTYHKFSFKDYGKLFFDTIDEADKIANLIPKNDSDVYVIINKRIYKRTIERISPMSYWSKDLFDTKIVLNKGKSISIKNIGITVFTTKNDAQKALNKIAN